jgi:hypothetical protein
MVNFKCCQNIFVIFWDIKKWIYVLWFSFLFLFFLEKKKKMPRGKWQMPTVATCTGIHMADYRQRGHEPRC